MSKEVNTFCDRNMTLNDQLNTGYQWTFLVNVSSKKRNVRCCCMKIIISKIAQQQNSPSVASEVLLLGYLF